MIIGCLFGNQAGLPLPKTHASRVSLRVNSHNRHPPPWFNNRSIINSITGRKRRGLSHSPPVLADSAVSDKTNEAASSLWPRDVSQTPAPARRAQCNQPSHLLARDSLKVVGSTHTHANTYIHTYIHTHTIWIPTSAAIAVPGLYSVFKFRTKTGGAVKLPRSQSSHRSPLSCLPLTYPPTDGASLSLRIFLTSPSRLFPKATKSLTFRD